MRGKLRRVGWNESLDGAGGLRMTLFMSLRINLQCGIDTVSEIFTLRFEPLQNIRINIQCHGHFLPRHPQASVGEE